MIKIYEYTGCGTCKKAKKYITEKGISATFLPIRETPPTVSELEKVYASMENNLKRLFNTSGQDYRGQNIKEKLPAMSLEQVFKLLSQNGNLIKRPFVVTEKGGFTGFALEEWETLEEK